MSFSISFKPTIIVEYLDIIAYLTNLNGNSISILSVIKATRKDKINIKKLKLIIKRIQNIALSKLPKW